MKLKPSALITLVLLLLLILCVPAFAQEASAPPAEVVSPLIQTALEPLFLKFVEFLLAVIGVGVVWLLKRLLSFLKLHLNHNQLVFLKAIVNEAALTAEQLGLAGAIADTASAKKEYATNLARERLAKAGLYTLANDAKGLSDSIEAAVMELFNRNSGEILASWSELDMKQGESLLQPIQ